MSLTLGQFWRREVLPRLTVEDIYTGIPWAKESSNEFRAPCPLHGGANKTSFKVNPQNLRYQCFAQCGNGGPLEFLNGGQRPDGSKFVDLVLGLAARVGVDASEFLPSAPRRRSARIEPRPIRKIAAPKRPDIRNLTGILGDAIGKGTRESLEWLRSRLPGVSDDTFSVLLEEHLIGNPALSKDRGEHGGAYELGRRGWRHMTILWSIDKPGIPSSAQLRWTGGDRGSRPKTLMMSGSTGGKHGAAFGRMDRVIDAARHTGIIYVTEGDADFALIRTLNFRNAIGVPGAMEAAKIASYIREVGWEGRLVLALDADAAGDAATAKVVAAMTKADGIEVLRARPPEGEDLNDVWVRTYRAHRASFDDDKLHPAVGASEAARAVVAVLEAAEVVKPSRGFDPKHPEHKEAIREYFEEIERTPEEVRKLRINLIRQNTEAMAKMSPPKELEKLRRIVRDLYRGAKDENKDAVRKVLASILVHPFTGIGEEAAAIAISDTFPGPAEMTKRKPEKAIAAALEDWPDEDDGAAFRRWGRELVELTSGDDFLVFAAAVSESMSTSALEYLRRLGALHGIQSKDKHIVRYQTIEDGLFSSDPRAKKLRGMTECGEIRIEHRLKDSGKVIRSKKTRCNCAECAFCQGSYIREMSHFLTARKMWGDTVIVGFVPAEKDTHKAALAAWERARDKLPRKAVPNLMGFMHPECPGFRFRAGAFVMARADDGVEDAMRECDVLEDVRAVPASLAIEIASRSQTARALRIMARIARGADGIMDEPWLDRMQTHRKRGDGLPWLAAHVWIEFRKDLTGENGIDNRPQTIEYTHERSGVLIAEHDAAEPPMLHHELIRLCQESVEVQEFLRQERRDLLPQRMANALEMASYARVNRRALF